LSYSFSESKVNIRTIKRFNNLMRLFCLYCQMKNEEKKIGGRGFILEIDEMCLRRRKWQRGRGKE
jgi:hypothetical protein